MQRIRLILRILLSYIPTPLPQSGQAMDLFIADILQLAKLPDNSSFRTAIATQIMHIGPTSARACKQSFIVALKKAIANQLAYEVIQREKASREQPVSEPQV